MTDGDRNARAVMNENPHSKLNWLLEELVTGVVGARHAVVLSTDGMLIERSNGLPKDEADQLAAMASRYLKSPKRLKFMIARTFMALRKKYCPWLARMC